MILEQYMFVCMYVCMYVCMDAHNHLYTSPYFMYSI